MFLKVALFIFYFLVRFMISLLIQVLKKRGFIEYSTCIRP